MNEADQKQVSQELRVIAQTLLTTLADPLNRCCGRSYSAQFWRRYVSYWMVNFVDAVFVEWLDLLSDVQNECKSEARITASARRATTRMTDLLEVSQQPAWRLQLKRDIQECLSGDAIPIIQDVRWSTSETETRRKFNPHRRRSWFVSNILRQQEVVLSTTYLPKRYELALGVMLGVAPLRWRDSGDVDVVFACDRRRELARHLESGDRRTFSSVITALLPSYLPWTTIEGIDFLQREYGVPERFPRVIFTANLHFSSDTFAFWAALAGECGAKVVVSQHGGLNGQGYIPTRDEEIEISEFDGYLNWGWSHTDESIKIPAQINLGRRFQLHARRSRQILLMCDATFRFNRRFWSDSGRYREHLLDVYRGIPVDLRSDVLVRLHRDHARYDESHIDFWKSHFPEARIDGGTKSIKRLYRQSRVVLCTTIGTTEIERFSQNQPVFLCLDRTLNRVRPEFEALLGKLEDIGIVHYSKESLESFLTQNFATIDKWWANSSVQSVVDEYLNAYGATSKRPLRDYRDVIVGLSRN